MNKLNSAPNKPPPIGVLPIIQRFVVIYRLWHESFDNIPKKSRYTLGSKIDSLFLQTIEILFAASFIPKESKLPYLQKASIKLDSLKFFFQIAWEIKAIDNKKYIMFSEKLNEIGKMLGGWIKGLSPKENPPNNNGGK